MVAGRQAAAIGCLILVFLGGCAGNSPTGDGEKRTDDDSMVPSDSQSSEDSTIAENDENTLAMAENVTKESENETSNSTTEDPQNPEPWEKWISREAPDVRPGGLVDISFAANSVSSIGIVRLPDTTIVINAGLQGELAQQLLEHEVRQVDVLVILQAYDHTLADCESLVEAYRIQVVIIPHADSNLSKDSSRHRDCMSAFKQANATVISDNEIMPGDYVTVSDYATLTIQDINNSTYEEYHDRGIILHLQYGDASVWFPGYLSCERRQDIVEAHNYSVPYQVMMAPYVPPYGAPECLGFFGWISPHFVYVQPGMWETPQWEKSYPSCPGNAGLGCLLRTNGIEWDDPSYEYN